MQSNAKTPDDYISELDGDRQTAVSKLRAVLKATLSTLGFEETMGAGMIAYVVPYSLYPQGYHCKPKQPLPFLNIASQKDHIAVYHLGLYSDASLLEWFVENYPKHTTAKLNMGKSCIRFKRESDIPYDLFEELAGKISAEKWIAMYEASRKQHKPDISRSQAP